MKNYFVTYVLKQKERALIEAKDSSEAMKKATNMLHTLQDAGVFDQSESVEIEIHESEE